MTRLTVTAAKLSVVALVAGGVLLASCTTPQFVDTACTAFQPITYSASQDSEATKAQIRGHNAAWVKLCK